ncbi:MAG: tetratricopeptide repeat protein [Blastocatellales bacterium]
MTRLWSYVESAAVAVYFTANFLTPANVRNTAGRFAGGSAQIINRLKRRKNLALTIIATALILSSPALAQTQSAAIASNGAPVVTSALSAEVIELRRAGNAAIYNLEYGKAREKFDEIKKLIPQHPAGDIYQAMLIWLEHLNKSRRLQTGLYSNNSSFYAGAENAKEDNEGDQVDPAIDRAFRDRMAQAKTKALALVARNKNDADAQYFLGAYYGVMAGYEATVARKFFAAMRNGSRSVDAHEKVIKLNPNYYDAYLSVGMYDYIVGTLPFVYKALATLAGVRGNKQRGIQRLETIVEKDANTADDARVLLMAIYQNEKRYEDALAISQHLNAKYPNSYLLKLETASALVTLKRTKEAFTAFEELLKDPKAEPAIDLVHFQYAEALAQEKDYKLAAEHFLSAQKAKSAEANLATMALLRAAQVYDLAGMRDEAIAQYKAVLERPNVYDSRQQAERGLKKPFVPKERDKKEDE